MSIKLVAAATAGGRGCCMGATGSFIFFAFLAPEAGVEDADDAEDVVAPPESIAAAAAAARFLGVFLSLAMVGSGIPGKGAAAAISSGVESM
jgi:hypothetical protein